MNDSETDVSVLVDRALGGASIADGELEIMLHRYFVHVWFETCETKREQCLYAVPVYEKHSTISQISSLWIESCDPKVAFTNALL